MPRYALIIEYDGTDFEGWQSQPSMNTIQDEVQKAIAICTRHSLPVTGSGRTDSGVHASFQVAHFDSETTLDTPKLFQSLNGVLPKTIAIKKLVAVDDSFHARFDAIFRTYRYHISTVPVALDQRYRIWVPGSISIDLMNEASRHFIGEFNFSSFCRTKSETRNRVCRIDKASWISEGREKYFLEVGGNRFLHGMVRAMVGTLFQIGLGKRDISSVGTIIQAEDRREAGPAADPNGLILHNVEYPDGSLPFIW